LANLTGVKSFSGTGSHRAVACRSLAVILTIWASAPVLASDTPTDTLTQEITVTAEKVTSTIQRTPFSASVLSGPDVQTAGLTSVEQAVSELPGFSIRTAGPGQTEYEARGLASNGGAAPTVGVYLDEVPLTPPALAQNGKVLPDMELFDIDRIETLRGPQGTLYGAGSMGGIVKVVTHRPILDTFEGSMLADASYTEGGAGNGSARLMLNMPLSDTVALRIVGNDTYRSGWIDRIVLDPFPSDTQLSQPPPYHRGNVLSAPIASITHGANTEKSSGGRTSLLFEPNADLSVVLTALVQHMSMGGYDEFDSPPGSVRLAHFEAFPIPEPITDELRLLSLDLAMNLEFAQLTSATAYWARQESQTQDASESISLTLGFNPYLPIPYSETDRTRQLSEEIRLTSSPTDAWHWVAGAFYSDLHSTWLQDGETTALSLDGGVINKDDNPYRVREYAVFADGSHMLTKLIELSAGLRWYRYISTQLESQWGYAAPNPDRPIVPLRSESFDRGYSPRVDLSYLPTPDLTSYASVSKGFRPGGVNQIVPPPTQPPYCTPVAPLTFGPDSVWSYELGEKARLLGSRVALNADIYYTRWNDVQQTLLQSCGYQYNENAGTARSYGAELEFNIRLSDYWSATGSLDRTNSRISNPNADYLFFLQHVAISPNGTHYCALDSHCSTPIFNVPNHTGNLSITYTIPLAQNRRFSLRLSDTLTGESTDEAFYFGIRLPAYNSASIRSSFSSSLWGYTLYCNNLTNTIAKLTANDTSFQYNIPQLVRYSTNQPRTCGSQIEYRF